MNYENRMEAFELAYREITKTACLYYEHHAITGKTGDFYQALATVAMASQMARAFNVDLDIVSECMAMI
jgi:hypothetical protein